MVALLVALLLVMYLNVMAVLLLLLLLIDVSETEEEPWCGCLAGQAMAGGLGLVLVPGGGEVQEWYVPVGDWRDRGLEG